jgi:hypothetical protein
MGEQQSLQAASVRQTARIFSIPARALYRAVRANELTAFCPSSGQKRPVLILDDVREWLRKHPASKPTNREACCG